MHPWEQLERAVLCDRATERFLRSHHREKLGLAAFVVSVVGVALGAGLSLATPDATEEPAYETARFEFIDAGIVAEGARLALGPDTYVTTTGDTLLEFHDQNSTWRIGEVLATPDATVTVSPGSRCICNASLGDAGTLASCLATVSGSTLRLITDQPGTLLRWICWL